MSIRLMTRAWDTKCESHTSKIVLLKLADNSNDQGFCWPSIATIAEQCELSLQGVRDQVSVLVEKKLLAVKVGGGRKSNCYHLFPAAKSAWDTMPTPPNGVGGTPQRRGGVPSTAWGAPLNGVDPNRHKPSVQPSNNPDGVCFSTMAKLLNEAFYRPEDSPWSYIEQSTLAELIRERPKLERELQMMLEWRSKLEPAKRKFFPTSIHSLLCNWPKTLDRARLAFREPEPTRIKI